MANSKSIIRTDLLSTDRLHGKVDKDIILCPICQNILWKPVACKTCENSFCLNCIRLWLNDKPNLCPFNCRFEQRKCPPILLILLSKLKLDCCYKSSGCTAAVPYEALEKHELEQCDYRIKQCPCCLQEMFKKDLDVHEKESCELVELTCLKCDTTYNQRQEHTEAQCLEKQLLIIKEKLNASEQHSKRMEENCKKMEEKLKREQKNDDYANRTELYNKPFRYASSVPTDKSPTIASSIILKPNIIKSTASPKESLRISTVSFARIPNAIISGAAIPYGYAGFKWYNAYYMFETHATETYSNTGFANAYTNDRKCVAHNGGVNPMSIFLTNSRATFGLHSVEAIAIFHENFKLVVNGYRHGELLHTKSVTLNTTNPTLIVLDWERVDKLTFTFDDTMESTLHPTYFALTCLNLLL